MDSMTAQTIVTAFTAGASFVGAGVAKEAVHDAYAQLKARMIQCYADLQPTITSLEHKPASSPRAHALQEGLEDGENLGDEKLLSLAQRLVELVRQQAATAPASVGVSLEKLDQAKVYFDRVTAGAKAVGVAIKDARGGEFHFGSVSAGGEKNV